MAQPVVVRWSQGPPLVPPAKPAQSIVATDPEDAAELVVDVTVVVQLVTDPLVPRTYPRAVTVVPADAFVPISSAPTTLSRVRETPSIVRDATSRTTMSSSGSWDDNHPAGA